MLIYLSINFSNKNKYHNIIYSQKSEDSVSAGADVALKAALLAQE